MNARWLSMLIGVLFAVALSLVFWSMHRIELRTRDGLRVILTGVLRAARESVDDWSRSTKNEVLTWVRFPEVEAQVKDLLRTGTARAKHRLDETLQPVIHRQGYLSYLILSLHGAGLAGGIGPLESEEGLKQIGATTRDLPRLRSGPFVRLPFRWNDHTLMAVSAPVVDARGKPIAIFAIQLDPGRGFSAAFRNAWSDQQIVSYGFDRRGLVISEINLHADLARVGLIRPKESTILSLSLRDPGGDLTKGFRSSRPRQSQPFTAMAEHALSGGSGIDLYGYRDFRGKKVIGAWEWDPKLGLGIATEINADQAYAPYIMTWRMMLLVMGVLLVGSSGEILYFWRRSRELNQAVDALREVEKTLHEDIELRNEFISVASHEIRTPLTPIRMELTLIGRLARSGTLASYPIQKLLAMNDISCRETQRIEEIVQNYLDVARIARGHFSLNLRSFDLAQLTKEVCERFSDQWATGNDAIQVISDESVRGTWDRLRMEQVLTLLLSNALKYANGASIEVEVHDGNPRATLSVRDHGPGIPKDVQSKVFERFEKADANHTMRGLGLGLYIVRRIVEDHGGTIRIESEPGSGTLFTVVLPKKPTAQMAT